MVDHCLELCVGMEIPMGFPRNAMGMGIAFGLLKEIGIMN